MFIEKTNIVYSSNFSRKYLLCPCMARKVTDNSWTIHHNQKCGGKKNRRSIDKQMDNQVIYPYSENMKVKFA